MSAPMSFTLALFCKTILLLDYIPRYGKLYRWNFITKKLDPPYWKFMKIGGWGTRILERMNLYWRYVDHCCSDIPWEPMA